MADNINDILPQPTGNTPLRHDDPAQEYTRKPDVDDWYIREPADIDENGRELIDLDGNKPLFKHERDVLDHWAEERKEREQAQAEEEEQRVFHERVEKARKIADPFDKAEFEGAFVETYNTEYAKHQQEEAAFEQAVHQRIAAAKRMAETNPALAQRMVEELKVEMKPRSEELVARREHFTRLAEGAQNYQVNRTLASARLNLQQSVPELADPVQAERFRDWLRSKGATEVQIVNEQNAEVIIKAANMWRQETEQARVSSARREIADTAFNTRGVGSEPDSRAAREALKETGSEASALRYLQTRAMERRRKI